MNFFPEFTGYENIVGDSRRKVTSSVNSVYMLSHAHTWPFLSVMVRQCWIDLTAVSDRVCSTVFE